MMTPVPRLRLLLSALALAGSFGAAIAEPLGTAPTYTSRTLTTVPNAEAVTRRIWVPGLDAGYVPQGVTHSGGALYVASYLSTDPKQNTGPCRLYRIDPASGATTGELDLPAPCGHAGGLAKGATPASLFVVDTRHVFEVAIATPPVATIGKVLRVIELKGAVKGSFAASSPGQLWLGEFSRKDPAKLYRFPVGQLKPDLTEADATASVALPQDAQGGAFDAKGQLWISRSLSQYGELLRLDAATGAVQQRFAMPAGLEDITFDADGFLWTLSEAGSRRWNTWPTFYPVIMRIDTARLR